MPTGLKVLIFGVVAIGFAIYMGLTEYKYITQGKETDGVVQETVSETRSGRYGRKIEHRVCKFTYDDAGETMSGKSDLRSGMVYQDGQAVRIEYIPGTWTARIAATKQTGFVTILLLVGVALIGVGIYLCRQNMQWS